MNINKENIVLIGMPGVGKSTIGVILAKELGYRFVDTDLLVQEAAGKLLKDIIEERGVMGFLQYEEDICAGVRVEHSVIATGGSVVYGEKAMAHLKDIATVVYLKLSYDELKLRLRDLKQRGVVLKDGQTLYDLYKERTVLYEKYADITICEDGLGIEDTLTGLICYIKGIDEEGHLVC